MKPCLVFLIAASLHGQSIDRRVDQANIRDTICVPGYTKTVRPPVAYTSRIKRRMMAVSTDPAIRTARMRDLELDHRIPLTLGGSPRDPRNFQLQPMSVAKIKDVDEKRLGIAVCRGTISLEEARDEIAHWTLSNPRVQRRKGKR